MNLELELQRLIKASNAVLYQQEECKIQRFSPSSREALKLKMYDLKTATKRAEEELKKNQIDLFS